MFYWKKAYICVLFFSFDVILYVFFFCQISNKKKDNSQQKKERNRKSNNQDSKFPATDGVNLEYFLTELSDDDSTSW